MRLENTRRLLLALTVDRILGHLLLLAAMDDGGGGIASNDGGSAGRTVPSIMIVLGNLRTRFDSNMETRWRALLLLATPHGQHQERRIHMEVYDAFGIKMRLESGASGSGSG